MIMYFTGSLMVCKLHVWVFCQTYYAFLFHSGARGLFVIASVGRYPAQPGATRAKQSPASAEPTCSGSPPALEGDCFASLRSARNDTGGAWYTPAGSIDH